MAGLVGSALSGLIRWELAGRASDLHRGSSVSRRLIRQSKHGYNAVVTAHALIAVSS